MLRAAMKDKSYQATPLGVLVKRYLRWFKNEWGATPATIRDYEAVLSRMSLTLADRQIIEVSIDDLRDAGNVFDLLAIVTRDKICQRDFMTGDQALVRLRGTQIVPVESAPKRHQK